jgi:hypothetical protein
VEWKNFSGKSLCFCQFWDAFFRNIAYGKTGTAVSSFEEFAAIADVEAWDGKDAVIDVEEDVSEKNWFLMPKKRAAFQMPKIYYSLFQMTNSQFKDDDLDDFDWGDDEDDGEYDQWGRKIEL